MANVNAGQLRGNPDAEATNFLKLTRCDDCDTVAAPCQDTLTATLASNITIAKITVDGVTTTLGTALSVSNVDGIRDAILALLGGEVDPVLNVTYVGTTFTIVHIGAQTLTNVITSTPVTVSGTRLCDIVEQCEFCATLVGEIGDIAYDGSTEALANNPYDWTGVALTDAATAAQLDTDLGTALTALGWTYVSITVTVDDVAEAFKVVIVSNESVAPGVGTDYFQKRNCDTIFTA